MRTILQPKTADYVARSNALVQRPWLTLAVFGSIVSAIGLGQLVLYIFPAMGFGSPEWEYGASAQLIGALPLATFGLLALFISAVGGASRAGLIALTVLLVLLGLGVLAVLGLFWSVVPMALKATPVALREPITSTIARTTLSGLGFSTLYFWAAGLAIRVLSRLSERHGHA
jgi:hypothetical protein